ncbi:TetR/AcrR family transcriptional regulator [Caulobacter mirabilis]|uniref:TetR family transcriptional regulator n=1 Tax=Caulobacter mirabilis TaxID=69666 RepID=A0A2D2B366_9CAUL|nr:TetR/AcrR family transcriptional regulator [Caulobacter mirabilis]ATQ44664.1 TetR family transcriptional regulator [Caulobacter mirabilis]
MPRVAGQIDVAKTEAILDAASAVLAERGLAAPMEEIARRAGVSKQTVYNHYGSKAELVRALVERRVDSITSPLREPGAEEHPEEALTAYAKTLLTVVVNKNYSLMRITIQSAGEMPDLAREVFEIGPMRSRAQLARFLELETRAGRMNVPDPVMAAEFFGGMVLGQRQTRALLNLPSDLTEAEMDAMAAEAARIFMTAYAA